MSNDPELGDCTEVLRINGWNPVCKWEHSGKRELAGARPLKIRNWVYLTGSRASLLGSNPGSATYEFCDPDRII